MVEVILESNQKGELVGFKIEGHAGFEQKGQDIVCAAVSILAQTTAASIQEILQVEPEVLRVQDGNLICRIGDLKEPDKKKGVQLLLESMVLGLKETSRNYPGYLEIKQRKITS